LLFLEPDLHDPTRIWIGQKDNQIL